MNDKNRKIAIIIAAILGCVGLFYLGGMLGQLLGNYAAWMDSGGVSGENTMKPVSWNPLICFPAAFSGNGIKGILMILLIAGAIFAYVKLHDKFDGKQHDPRGFARSKSGIYGTASWMDEKEMKEVLEISPVPAAKGTILGEYKGKAVCMPEDTRLNRHIAVFGASGTMKSRAIIRNALFQALRRGESVIVTDSKGELYADTSEMFRNEEYDVKIYNLVSPEHGDSWNCMSDLNGDTLMAQVLTNVIIGNTSSGKGDHFWDNGEGNLLKALILLIDQDRTRSPDMKHLPAVYQLLTQNSERQLTAMFDKLPLDHPARAPFNLFAQSSDTVRSGIILGLGTRLQVLQNQAVQRITSQSDIDLTAPGRNKCIYYIVLSDQDATMAFLSSLFFSFMFIKLTRYADGRPNGRCDVPVNLILDEFNNIGRIGGAEDGSDFARSLSVVRSRDIRVMLTVQSLGQLQNRYPKNLWSEIIGNCDIQLMLGCTDDVTAEYISARSGDMSVQVNSTMTVRQTIAVAQVIPQYRHTEGQGRRRLLTPDEVLRLPNEELLCILRGHNILKLNKLDFTKHPMAKQIVKASVYDYKPTADKAKNDLLDLIESQRSGRILTGTIQGVEQSADNPRHAFAVLYHGEFKVIIPAAEAVEPPEDYRGRDPDEVLHYMLTKRLGAEVDYIVKGIDPKSGIAAASRLEAMRARRKEMYFGTDRDGNNRIYAGVCAEARVVSAIRAGIFIDLFGVESYIPLKELSYQRWMDAAAHFQPGQRILVKVLDVDRSDRDHVRVSASVKQAGENPYEKALRRYSVGNRYVGTVSMVDVNGVFVALDGGIDCLCSYPKRGRPPRGARVTVRILGINHETNRIWGAITHIAMPH